jgi:hypothetical protein
MERTAIGVLRGFCSKERLIVAGRLADPGAGDLKLRVTTGSGLRGVWDVTPVTRIFDLPVKGRRGDLEVRFELAEEGPPVPKGGGRPAMIVERIEVLTGKTASLPSVLEIESSTRCNINPPCVMCYPRIFDKRGFAGDIDEAAFSRLIPYLQGFRTISLHGVGEPLLGRKLAVILDHIDRERTWVQFNSNGLLLTEDRSRELVPWRTSDRMYSDPGISDPYPWAVCRYIVPHILSQGVTNVSDPTQGMISSAAMTSFRARQQRAGLTPVNGLAKPEHKAG